jgi:predicted dehydrogenase
LDLPFGLFMKTPAVASSRRQFIKTAAATVATFNIVPRHVLGGPGFVAPSEKVNVALIGGGGQGHSNLKNLFQLEDVQVIAVADTAEAYDPTQSYAYYKGMGGRAPTKEMIEKNYAEKTPNFRCAAYEDFRVMLEKEKSIDAVLCATPDHTHAYISIHAMRAGKHVYCEKPLTHNIWEAHQVAKVAKETGVATQMGSQGHSSVGTRETIEYIQGGAIGNVQEVHIWVPATRYNYDLKGYPTDTPKVPAGLNWDLWLGPREERAYNPAYHPFSWRDFWAFGSSGLGDFGTHDMNSAVRALELWTPTLVEGYGVGFFSDEIAPYGSLVHYHFPANDKRKAIKLTWYSGGMKPAHHESLGAFTLPKRGSLYVGDKGVIQTDGSGGAPRLFPAERRVEFAKPEPRLKRSNGHHRDWIDACKGGEPASCPFDYGAQLTETVLLGVLSQRLNKPIHWDAPNMKATGLPEADAIIRESYRPGWEIV